MRKERFQRICEWTTKKYWERAKGKANYEDGSGEY
jgi:hypothetical protein